MDLGDESKWVMHWKDVWDRYLTGNRIGVYRAMNNNVAWAKKGNIAIWVYNDEKGPENGGGHTVEHYENLDLLQAQCVLNHLMEKYYGDVLLVDDVDTTTPS